MIRIRNASYEPLKRLRLWYQIGVIISMKNEGPSACICTGEKENNSFVIDLLHVKIYRVD